MLKRLFSKNLRSKNQKQKKTKKVTFLYLFLLGAIALVFNVAKVQANTAPVSPTILSPSITKLTTAMPLIAGVSFNDTIVEIYIDNTLAGNTTTNNHPSGTGNFFWQVQNPLSTGKHIISTLAINNTTKEKSALSKPLEITIVPFGGPTLIAPEKIVLTKAFTYVEGVAHNNSIINVYINGDIVDTFTLGESSTGAVGFKHQLKEPIKSGFHTIYLQAQDSTGRLSVPSKTTTVTIVNFPPPTILTPAKDSQIVPTDQLVSGVAYNNSLINIYVDDVLDGQTTVKNHPSGVGYFSYNLTQALTPGDEKVINAYAISPDGRQSPSSNTVTTKIVPYYIPPTLLHITGASNTPTVAGVAHNNSTIKILVDGITNTKITPANDPSGTLYFKIRLAKIGPGAHTITAIAFDTNNKPSTISNALNYTYTVPAAATPTKSAEPVVTNEPTSKKPITVTEPGTEGTEEANKEDKTNITIKEEKNTGTIEVIEPGTEGTIEVPDNKEGTVEIVDQTDKTDEVESAVSLPTETNWPLILGLIILIGLAIIFIIWYLGQKRKLLNEGIDKLFSDEETDNDFDQGKFDQEKTDPSDDIPPPPPAI